MSAGRHISAQSEASRTPKPGADPQRARVATGANRQPDWACRVITDLAGWRELESVWDQLLAASPDHTPWQGFAFLTSWWKHLGGGMSLRVFVVERAGEPCLVLPMQISRLPGAPGLSQRVIEPVSMIADVNRPRLALGRFDQQAYHCAFDAIWQRQSEWHALAIDEKPWEDQEIALLKAYAQRRGAVFRQRFAHMVPYLNLKQSWPDFLNTKSQKFRKNLKTARKKLEQRGQVELRHYRGLEGVQEGFAAFLHIHERSWKKDKQIEQSKSPEYNAFFKEWLLDMATRDQATVLVLHCGKDPVAATIALTEGDVYYSAQIVHDNRYAACSPGTLLESLELEHLMGEGRYARYEFLGSFLNNKMRWAQEATSTALVEVIQPSLRALAIDAYDATFEPYIRPQVKAAFKKLSPAWQTRVRKVLKSTRRRKQRLSS